jgi:hypothetical protein
MHGVSATKNSLQYCYMIIIIFQINIIFENELESYQCPFAINSSLP